MADNNYEVYQADINALHEFASREGWSIAGEKEIDYGYQMVVFDGITKNPVDFFPSGKILVQGKPGALRTQLLAWREERSSTSASKYEKTQLPFADAQSQQSLHTGTTIATGIARIGMDESGKGDYFGPLSIGAVYVDTQTEARLVAVGVRDSKLLSDMRILALAQEIKALCPHFVVTIEPRRYNEAYEKIQNLN